MSQTDHSGSTGNGCKVDGLMREEERFIRYGILFISIVTLLAYSSVFSAGFIWDDNDHVISIAKLDSIGGLARIWFEPGVTIQYYPMVFSAFWAQIHLWGLHPFGFHLVNIVLHIGNALLLWLCLRRLEIPGAFWAACIFALHPVHVESVAWVTELKNILSAFFYLLAFLCYWRFSSLVADSYEGRNKAWLYYAASLILFILALFSKTVTCTLPAVILLLFWWKRGRIELREIAPLLPFFMLAAILGKITMGVEADHLMAKGPEWDFSAVERLLIAGRVTWFHAGKMLWPSPLMFNYPRWHLDVREWWQYLYPASALGLLSLLWYLRDRAGRGLLAACLFIIGTNFPVLGFLNVYSMRFSFVADHYYYIANFGVIVLFCAATSLLQQKLLPSAKHVEKIFFGAILLALSLLTWQQGKIYNNNLALFNDIIDKNPASWFGYANRALHYVGEGKYDLAMAELEKTIELKPDEADALHNRGLLFVQQGKFDSAFADFDRAIAVRPWRTDYIKNRSQAYRLAGRLDEALADANKALEQEADNAGNYQMRAFIYLLREEYPAALRDLDRALTLNPEEADAWANRGLVFLRQGLIGKAIDDFNRSLALSPDTAATYYNRGVAFAAAGNAANALADLQEAKRLGYSVRDEEITRARRAKR